MLVNNAVTGTVGFVPTCIFVCHTIVSVTLLELGFQYVP